MPVNAIPLLTPLTNAIDNKRNGAGCHVTHTAYGASDGHCLGISGTIFARSIEASGKATQQVCTGLDKDVLAQPESTHIPSIISLRPLGSATQVKSTSAATGKALMLVFQLLPCCASCPSRAARDGKADGEARNRTLRRGDE